MKASQFASNYRTAVQQLLEARATLKALREQDGASQVGGAGIVANMTTTDLTGSNADLTPADFSAAFTVLDEIEALLTDFTKTPPIPTTALASLQKFLN